MQVIRGLHNIPKAPIKGYAATIGNYDGIHIGHQQILTRLKEKAAKLGIETLVITFEPLPQEFFGINTQRLMSLTEKLKMLSQYNIDRVLVLPFNRQLSALSGNKFIENILIKRLNIRHLIIGNDFHFGNKRKGSYALLKQYNFEIEIVPELKTNEVRVSSTSIRSALLKSDLAFANKTLGRPYHITGKVIKGQKLGSTIGFPTANISLCKRDPLLQGVYAVKLHGLGKNLLYGVANIGFCPTVAKKHKTLEVHIFDLDQDLYGKKVTVEFIKKIRPEKKFDSLSSLTNQIKKDIANARKIFRLSALPST